MVRNGDCVESVNKMIAVLAKVTSLRLRVWIFIEKVTFLAGILLDFNCLVMRSTASALCYLM